MASSYDQYLNSSTRRGYSKSQMCLFKILHIISSIPPSKGEPFPSNNKGIGIDLNLRFCSFEAKIGQSEEACATASDASAIDQGNKNNNGGGGGEEEEESVREKSVDTQVQSFEVGNNGVDHVESESEEDVDGNRGGDGGDAETASFQERGQDSNCLDLLIEAARVLSGKDESDSEEVRELDGELRTQEASQGDLEEGGRVKKRKERWVVVDLYSDVMEDREPVVRSKRGRNQTLPYRFRDSVVEPLKRLGRSSATANNARKRLFQ